MVAALGLVGVGVTRADELGLRDRLAQAFVRAHRAWPPAPEPYLGIEDSPDQHWTKRRAWPPTTGLEWRRACPVDSSGRWEWAGGEECSTNVFARFLVDGDTVRSTFGRVQEGCNETPRLEWRDRAGRSHREPLTPAFDFNVAAVWVTRSWLVFELSADYEGGPSSFRIAAWNLATGAWAATPHGDWASGDRPRRLSPRPLDVLGGLSDAEVAEADGRLYLRRGARTLVLWPGKRTWAMTSL